MNEFDMFQPMWQQIRQSSGDINQLPILPIFLLMICRLFPFVHLSYYLGARNLPIPVRVALGIALFISSLPLALWHAQSIQFGASIAGLMFIEVFIGFMLGFINAIPFYIMTVTGMIIDNQRGAPSLMGTDPALQVQNSPIGVLLVLCLIHIYWRYEIPFRYIESVAESYRVLPLGGTLPGAIFYTSSPLYTLFMSGMQTTLTWGVRLSGPALVMLMMTDMFLGIVNRLAPQIMISFLAQGLKALTGLYMVWLAWFYILETMKNKGLDWHGEFNTLIQLLQPQ